MGRWFRRKYLELSWVSQKDQTYRRYSKTYGKMIQHICNWNLRNRTKEIGTEQHLNKMAETISKIDKRYQEALLIPSKIYKMELLLRHITVKLLNTQNNNPEKC